MNINNWKLKISLCLLTIILISFFFIRPYWSFINNTLNISIIKTLFSKNSLKTYNNQVNILLLGIAGGKHDGPNLSDSIIVINYNFKLNKLTTISIPRDIWSETLQDKINSAYAYGEAKKPGKGGFILAKAEIEEIVGLPIQYAAVIDFQQFKELIDYLGGVPVEVETSFIDNKYPVLGKENDECNGDKTYQCRYETISFKKGITLMSGETALKFARSRNAEGKEGTDFAREKRQQKVIEATKNQLIKLSKKPNIKTFERLYKIVDKLIKREMTNQQAAIILKNIIIKGNFKQEKIVLDEKLFINPSPGDIHFNNLWVLVPKENNYKEIHEYILSKLKNKGE